MEARPSLSVSRCDAAGLVTQSNSVRFSAICPYSQSNKKDSTGQSEEDDFGDTNVAEPELVSGIAEYGSSKSSVATSAKGFTKRSSRRSPSTNRKQDNELSGLGGFRRKLASEGVSERAANLISASRRESSLTTYSSSWDKWASWCSQQKVDSFWCGIEMVLDFLAKLFDDGLMYNTICHYRSSISAFHEGFQGMSVDEHPRVSSLITGVFNKRPPQPRHLVVWDVGVVFNYLKGLSKDGELSDKMLTFKTAMLIALTSATRSSDIHRLDLHTMEVYESKIIFTYNRLHKSWRSRKKPLVIVFHSFKEDPRICVVKTIKDYIQRISSWRSPGQNQLFLSYIKPHKPICSSTIARWLKQTLSDTGINTDIFSAHSTRSASASKADAEGVNVEEILKRGTWSSKTTTWQKHYRREVVSDRDQGRNFQEKVYSALN